MRIELFQAFTIILSVITTLVTVNTFFNTKVRQQREEALSLDKRLTLLEVKQEEQRYDLMEHKKRLDNHDKQNEALIKLTEQITNLSEKVDKIDDKLEQETKK